MQDPCNFLLMNHYAPLRSSYSVTKGLNLSFFKSLALQLIVQISGGSRESKDYMIMIIIEEQILIARIKVPILY